jgi:hypothetical protein
VGETVWREDGEVVALRFKRIGHHGRRLWVMSNRQVTKSPSALG